MTNPLTSHWENEFELPPFDRICDADFEPAIMAALAQARENLRRIATSQDVPTIENTIDAMELADAELDKVLGVFYNVAGADSNTDREALQRKLSPILAVYSSDVLMDPELFARVDALWDARDELALSSEQSRVLMLTHRRFVRAGARLDGAERARLKDVMERLAVLGTEFTQNLLADERDWSMALSEEDVSGLPDFVANALRAAGGERGEDGPAVTLSRSVITPFLQHSPNRMQRKLAHDAYTARGANGGAHDNRSIAAETLALREERATLLGYDSFADFKLETEMAGSADKVRDLLMSVWKPARVAAISDAKTMTQMLHNDGYNGDLEPWDWHYYAERRREAEHNLDEAEIKPYLQLDRMVDAVFDVSNRLFGLEFSPLDVPLYHPDAKAWKVSRNGAPIATFIGDYFARGSKRSGAWCSAMRSQQKLAGDIQPIVVNVCNFAKPEAGQTALLSWDDARTLFHEFGHALHQMLSNVSYPSISGTSVARDFVELPSQLLEHWMEVPEVLGRFATHAETGEPIPEDLLARLLAASTHDAGFQTVEFLSSAIVDLAFHEGAAPRDPMVRQAQVLEEIGMPSAIKMRHATPQFAHVFSGDGYACGYYSYMWSEVMDADAFEAFQEVGDAFDPALAQRLETHILSAGGSKDAAELYTEFRGRMPGVDALLRGRGLGG